MSIREQGEYGTGQFDQSGMKSIGIMRHPGKLAMTPVNGVTHCHASVAQAVVLMCLNSELSVLLVVLC